MRAVQFIFSHSLFAALCAVGFCFETTLLLQTPHTAYLYLFVFFATLGSYNFHLLMGAFYVDGISFLSVVRQHKVAAALIGLSAAVLLLTLPKLWYLWPYIVPAFVATALYSLVLLPFKVLTPLRRAGFAKTFLLALTWAFVTVLLPLQKNVIDLQGVDVVFMLHRFCLMLQLCLLFDLRDTAIDKIKGLHSLATDISPIAAHRFFYVLAFVYLALSALLAIMLQHWLLAVAFAGVQAATLYLYRVPISKRTYFYYYFLIDGLMLLSVLLTSCAYWLLA